MLVPYNETGIGPLVAKCFPSNRKPIRVAEFSGPVNVNSYWDGGSKNEYTLINLETMEVWDVPTSHPFFDRNTQGERVGNIELKELPPNTALICGGTFCGKPATVRVLLRPENMVKMLPAPSPELSDNEKTVIGIVCCMTSAGRKNEFERRGLGQYGPNHPVITQLVAKGLLKATASGAISATLECKNLRSANRNDF